MFFPNGPLTSSDNDVDISNVQDENPTIGVLTFLLVRRLVIDLCHVSWNVNECLCQLVLLDKVS